ncbi:UTP--glucose-1-phosphate uridylyltransferase [Spirochaeta lutea]|uniref:UTP--glucose-1-phosphate uridylyltransferase n=1 Tax=Spirochaeta lutea TaxID=1480694 RepID=UPI00056BC4A7|nr:UTP--glucose-1-phosphate uridylyltransferase [Spirochaeta lutea]
MNNQELAALLEHQGIDADLSLSILERYNTGALHRNAETISGIPNLDGDRILDHDALPTVSLPASEIRRALGELGISASEQDTILIHLQWLAPGKDYSIGAPEYSGAKPLDPPAHDTLMILSPRHYTFLGWILLPLVSFGVLNGGSATSYADEKKNKQPDPGVFSTFRDYFARHAKEVRGIPKGIAPGYYNQDGSPGPSFLVLKLRASLLMAKQCLAIRKSLELPTSQDLRPLFPFFQMTSRANTETILNTYREYENHPLLRPLAEELGIKISDWKTGIQPMVAALTHSDEGEPKSIFLKAYGKPHTPLALPGGHGQNFLTLRTIYRDLFNQGKRLVYLGNVDNLGFLPDPQSIGYLVIDGACAAFDFAFKTRVDTKGGILLRREDGGLTCADIGPAISPEEVSQAEDQGTKILFNCATGLFRLDYLDEHLERIIEELPTRITDQNKDAGKYSQAEQVTWEVLSLLDRFLVFGVNKYHRFLAAKILMDTYLTSGLLPTPPDTDQRDQQDHPARPEISPEVYQVARELHEGLEYLLTHRYGLIQKDGTWIDPGAGQVQ